MIRRPTVRVLLAAAIGAFVPALTAATADASLSIASFSITPSTTQAGGTLDRPGPNLTIDASFSSRDGDTPRNATVSLAPGLLANPSGIPVCPASAFQAGACPDDSRIGAGTITGTAPQFAFTLTLPTDAYLVQPQGSEAARIGLIASFFDFPVATQSAPVTIRTQPDVGLDIPLTGLPNDVDGVPVKIDGLHLTIFGAVGGKTFTRNPTSCSPATSTLTVDSYGDPGTSHTQQSSFTPTGCGSLPYAPAIAGTVAKDQADDGIAITTTLTQQYDESDDRSIDLTLPRSASPRLSALGQACSNADLTTCPSIGTAQVKTPLLTQTLTAPIVLVAHPGAIPTLAILIPQPIGLQLDATPVLTGDAVRAIVMNIPDVPIASLTLNLPGGPSSLFRAGVHLCTAPQSFSAALTGWSGATANPTAAATVTGCPATAPAATSRAASSAPRTADAQTAADTPSHGAVSIDAFTLTPSTTAAGANPDVTVDVKLNSTGTDSLRDATVALAPGLVADPSVATTCSAADFAADTCPAASKIGDGEINATAIPFDTPVSLPIGAYLLAPQGTEAARVGVIAELFDFPVASVTDPVTIRTSPDVGLDIPLTNIPNQTDGTPIQINELMLHLFASVNGHPFTRNPTSCAPANTTLTIDSYADATPHTQTSSFTPTGCSALGYAPKLTADATVDPHDDGLAFTAHITQNAGDATTRTVTMTLPQGLQPRLGTLLNACKASDPSSCPAIGSASVASPLLPAAVTGKLVLASAGAGLPTLEAIFGPPLSLTLHGTPSLTKHGISATFDDLPDVPISALDVSFAGGAHSAFAAGATLCTQPQTLTADLTAHSDATAHLAPTVTVHGSCASGPSGPHPTAGKPTGRLVLSHLAGRHPAVKLIVKAGANAPALRRIAIKLPRGLAVAKRRLTLALKTPKRQVTVTLKAPALHVSGALVARIHRHHKVRLTATVAVTDAGGTATRLHLKSR